MSVKFTYQHVPSDWRENISSTLAATVAQHSEAALVAVRRMRGVAVLRLRGEVFDDALVANIYDASGNHVCKVVAPSLQLSA